MEENRNEIKLYVWLHVSNFIDEDQNKVFNLTEVINSEVQTKNPICLYLELLHWNEMGLLICC